MKAIAPIFLITAAACLSSATAATVIVNPDSVNRIFYVNATPTTQANTVDAAIFSTYWQGPNLNVQRSLLTTNVATFTAALNAQLGPLGAGQSYQINSASLTVGDSGNDYADVATAHQLLRPYDTATVTWNNFDDGVGGSGVNGGQSGTEWSATVAATSVAGTNSSTWDLTSVVQDWLSPTPSTSINSLMFQAENLVDSTGPAASTTSSRVSWSLDAEIIPEPSAAMLGGIGILLLLHRRRA